VLLFVDAQDRIIAIFAGRPKGEDWDQVINGMVAAFEEARKQTPVMNDGRGEFSRLQSGYSYGGGQTVCNSTFMLGDYGLSQSQEPRNIANSHQAVVDELLRDKNVRRVAGFQNNAFSRYAPKLYQQYTRTVNALRDHDPKLFQCFPESVFPSVTFNLGPQTVCAMHVDNKNVAYGLCSITSAGTYNPALGGHTILWQLKRVVQFPPGCTIYIPSATIAHGNTPIGEGETRYSLTQYCAGSLMCWVAAAFRTKTSLDKESRKHLDADNQKRHMEGLDSYSKVAELFPGYG